jgi:magnesium and cobalt transporter
MEDADLKPHPRPTLFERLSALLTREPEDREELKDLLRGAFERRLLDADALSMIEGVLSVSEMTVRDIMIPRAQMDCVSIDDQPSEFIPFVIDTKHSRFPVIGESKDDIVGILLAKELLNFYHNPDGFVLRDTLRPAVFVPESKRLNVLLREFRANRNHIAIVVDEYGGVSGLVTIEDVLEQIVGDIDDEYDFDESEDNVIAEGNGRWRVKAQTEIADFNEHFGSDFADDEFDTVGGLVVQAFGRLPKRGESTILDGLRFRVVRADSRRVHTLQVERAENGTPLPPTAAS